MQSSSMSHKVKRVKYLDVGLGSIQASDIYTTPNLAMEIFCNSSQAQFSTRDAPLKITKGESFGAALLLFFILIKNIINKVSQG